MAEKDRLYEVTRVLSNADPLNEEIAAAVHNLKNCFQKNYVRKIYMAADSEEKKVKNKPSREVVLLRALKAFTPPPQHHAIENTIETLNFFNAMQNVQHNLSKYQNDEKTITIRSEEGEEAVVTSQNLQTTKALMLLALMGRL